LDPPLVVHTHTHTPLVLVLCLSNLQLEILSDAAVDTMKPLMNFGVHGWNAWRVCGYVVGSSVRSCARRRI